MITKSKIQIRRGIPLPPDGRTKYEERPYNGRSPYPFPRMRVMDSFVVRLKGPGNTAKAVKNRLGVGCFHWGRRLGSVFVVRTLKGQIGVWRIR